MKRFKKLAAGLMGVVMALGVCSFTAFAAETVTIEDVDDLTAAIAGQEDGQTWKITGDFDVTALVDIHENIVINGNGHTLTFDENPGISSGGHGKNSFIQITGGATVEINDLTIDGNKSVKHCINVYTGSGDEEITTVKLDGVIMNDGTGYGLVNNSSNVTVTDIETSGNGWGGINVDNPPDAGKVGAEFEMISGTIGEKTSVKIENRANDTITAKINAKINGGTFEGDVFIDDDVKKATLTITNGTFANDVTKYMDNGSKLLKDEEGNYVVMDDKAFEKSDKEFYISDEDDLKLAEKYQADGVTWVLAECTYKVEETIKLNKNVIIEGNDSTIEFTKEIYNSTDRSERCGFNIDGGANVEISGLTIEGNKNIKHCINVYTGKGQETTTVKLNGVIMKDGKEGYGLVNNASDVTVKNIETSGNDWGGINVDNAVGAGTDGAKFTMVSGTINEEYSIAFENKTGASIDAEIKDGTFKGYVGYGINEDSFGEGVDPKKTVDVSIKNGTFKTDVSDFMDEESHLVKDDNGNFVIMDEEEYDKYLDSKRPTHSYSLEEGRVDRNDEEEEPVVTTKPEEEAGPFSDVGKDNPNYDAIIKVYEKGWMAGIGDGVFAPNGTLTRAMGAMVLWNKAGCPEPQNVAPFLDVTSDAWYAKAVAWAYEQGIVAGYGETFGPGDALTTEQFTRMNDIATGKTPEAYIGGAPNATRGWVASLLAM